MTDLEIAVAPCTGCARKRELNRVSESAAKELAKALEEIGR